MNEQAYQIGWLAKPEFVSVFFEKINPFVMCVSGYAYHHCGMKITFM